MVILKSEIPVLERAPKGADIAAIFPENALILTYWDLWVLISAQNSFHSNLPALRHSLVDRRLNNSHCSFSREDHLEDLIALLDDLTPRIHPVGDVDSILASIPEKLLKKETRKGINNITDDRKGGWYPPSEPMMRSPRRLLKTEAMRGMWPKLPIDPTPITERLRPLFIPKPKPGYFTERATFALTRRLEKAVAKEIKKSDGQVMHHRAYHYAVLRSALTLFQEENSWDDSGGEMGNLGKQWFSSLFHFTADALCLNPRIFLKDLLMFSCWEVYGIVEPEMISHYIHNLPGEEQTIALEILVDIKARAAQGFQFYRADQASRIIEKIDVLI